MIPQKPLVAGAPPILVLIGLDHPGPWAGGRGLPAASPTHWGRTPPNGAKRGPAGSVFLEAVHRPCKDPCGIFFFVPTPEGGEVGEPWGGARATGARALEGEEIRMRRTRTRALRGARRERVEGERGEVVHRGWGRAGGGGPQRAWGGRGRLDAVPPVGTGALSRKPLFGKKAAHLAVTGGEGGAVNTFPLQLGAEGA